MKAATKKGVLSLGETIISIHAAREGGDITEIAMAGIKYEFQSTPPVKAATLYTVQIKQYMFGFQSTPPVKAATFTHYKSSVIVRISIHAAREGGDFLFSSSFKISLNFNPRRP